MVRQNGTISAPVDSAFGRLVEELTNQLQVGEVVDWPAVAREHPEQADELAAIRPALEMLGQLSHAGNSALSGIAPAPTEDDTVAGVLGDFRIIREVGRGGMGVVYEAEQISLARRVALKVLPYAGALDAKQLQRFKNEAKAAASLKHEHIVQVHAIGCERGVHYYAMEFIEGQTLGELIADFRLPIDDCKKHDTAPRLSIENPQSKIENATAPIAFLSTERTGRKGREFYRHAAELIADAADALEHAHSLGIVHRDVKPGNLLLDGDGKVYVSDFGLARFGPDASLTMTGDLLGTLRYMAPEQALARHGLADHRVDVYGLGATLYELLTGRPAVGGEDKAEIVRHIAFEEPVAPRKLNKSIPAELETIALKCLVKSPGERYATAGELAADLRRWLHDTPIQAKPPTVRQRLAKLAARHRGAVKATTAVLALAVVAMAIFTAVVVKQRKEIGDALGQAQTNLATADNQRQRAWQAVDDMYTQVAEKWLSQEPGMTGLQREFLEKALHYYEDLSKEEGDSPELLLARAEAYGRMGSILTQLERREEAEKALRRAIADFESVGGSRTAVTLARHYNGLAYLLFKLPNRQNEAIQASNRALALFGGLPNDEAANAEIRYQRGRAMTTLSGALAMAGRHAEGEAVCRQGVEILRSLVAEFPTNAKYRHVLGGLLGQQALATCNLGRPSQACTMFGSALV